MCVRNLVRFRRRPARSPAAQYFQESKEIVQQGCANGRSLGDQRNRSSDRGQSGRAIRQIIRHDRNNNTQKHNVTDLSGRFVLVFMFLSLLSEGILAIL